MEKITEFDLLQALNDCSIYVRDLPTKEEAYAIKSFVCQLVSKWIEQQNLSIDEKFKLVEKVYESGPLRKAAKEALRSRYPSLMDG